MKFIGRNRWVVPATAVGVVGAAFVLFALWKAQQALREADRSMALEGEIKFREVHLDRPAAADVEMLSAAGGYRDAVVFAGRLYLCGAGGLSAYSLEGTQIENYRPGFELPPSPLVGMAVGVSTNAAGPQLWLGTESEGLLVFDGRQFRQIRPEAEAFRALTAVLPLETGRVLMGTREKGLLVYDGKRIQPYHPGFSGVPITALAGSESDLWAGTLDRGVLHWQGGQLDRIGEGEGLPDARVLGLALSGGAAYVGTAIGVAEVRGGRVVRVLGQGLFAQSLLVRGDKLLVGTIDEGVLEAPLEARPPRLGRPSWTETHASVLRLLEFGGTLYALSKDGLYAAQKGVWRRVAPSEEGLLRDMNVSALSVDDAGRLWVGFFDRGLQIIEPGGGRSKHVENEYVFCVNRIVHDPSHAVTAVATANGLALFDNTGRQREVLTRRDGLIASHVTDVVVVPGGMVAATPAGISYLGAGGPVSLYAFHGLVNNHVYALAAHGNRVLAGTLGGLSVIDGGLVSASHTTANSGLRHNWVTALARVDEEWFVGTYGAGILRYDGAGRWSGFQDLPGHFEVNANAMLVTPRLVLAGTLGRGLLAYDRSSGRWRTISSGLPSLNVTALAEHEGSVYIGTDNGLVRVSGEVLAGR